MADFTTTEWITKKGLKGVLSYLDGNPEENMEKVVDWVIKIDHPTVSPQAKVIKGVISEDSNWSRLIKSLWTDIDKDVRKKLFENFIINAVYIGGKRQDKMREKHQCNVPWAILMDPTSACNLNCIGCWAAEYGNQLNMSYETLSSIVKQGKDLGVFFYIFSGGEPMVRKDDIIRLCEEHDDCVFLAFTNGTLIDEKFADEMLRVKNFLPAISVEGFEDATDFRRGDGTYKKLSRGMEILKEKKLPFGISCCYTSKNTDVIGSEEYFDAMIERGAKFAWLFTYMPVGEDAVVDLMASAEQRKYMYDRIREYRSTKSIFTMDFWNDGEYVNGCIAGGRRYLHINANGDIEPCAFIHYADSNIHSKSLLEALKSPLFMGYHRRQPFNDNHLRPCPLLDNNGALAEIVHESGAKSTDFVKPENVDALCAKCKNASEQWAPVADDIWAKNNQGHECRIK